MTPRRTASTLGMMVVAPAAAAQPSAALSPQGKWSVEYNPERCIASRTFAAAGRTLILAMSTAPLTRDVSVNIFEENVTASSGKARVAIGDAIESDVAYVRTISSALGKAVTTITIARPTFKRLATAKTLMITTDAQTPVTFSVGDAPAIMRALATCEADLAKVWAVSELPEGSVAAEAVRPEDWIRLADYPAKAIADRQQGRSVIAWKIGVDGRVSDCHSVISSGFPILDAASCTAVTTRGRYKPATNAAGQPIESFAKRYVIWRLPE